MGCDSSYMRGYEEPILRKQLDEVTRLLCGVLTIVEKDSIMLSVRGMVPGLPEWWDEHKEADRKRLEKEAQEQARQGGYGEKDIMRVFETLVAGSTPAIPTGRMRHGSAWLAREQRVIKRFHIDHGWMWVDPRWGAQSLTCC
jgi:hypothetical protein